MAFHFFWPRLNSCSPFNRAAACRSLPGQLIHYWSRTNSLPVLHINFKLDTLAFLFLFSVDLSACPALELASTYWRSTSFQCWTPAPPLLLWDYSQWRKKRFSDFSLSSSELSFSGVKDLEKKGERWIEAKSCLIYVIWASNGVLLRHRPK